MELTARAAATVTPEPPSSLLGAKASGVEVVEHDDAIGLVNPQIGLLFSKSDGTLLGIWPTGQKNLLAALPKTALWAMEETPAGTEKPVVIAPDASSKVAFATKGDANELTLDVTYDTPRAHVIVHARLASQATLVHWRIEAESRGDNPGIWSVTFPQFAIAALDSDPAGNEIVVPYRRGQARGFGKGAPKGDAELPYPGPSAKFQFLAAYGRAVQRGFYFSTEDGQGFTKAFAVRNHPETDSVILSAQHFPAGRGAGVKRYEMTYDTVGGSFAGDWWDAARIYRQWWTQQVWASRGLLAERKDIPEWLIHAPIATRPSTTKPERTLANNVATLHTLSDVFSGTPFFGIWYGCFETAKAGASLNESGYGHDLPPKPGLVDAVKELRGRGVHLQAYIQSMIYDAGIAAPDVEAADHAVTRDRQGNRVPYGSGEPQLLSMCRATDWWQNRLVELSRRAVGEWGFSGVYLDSFGKGAPECFASDHGHPVGGGDTVIRGQRKLVQRVRDAVRAVDREAILSGEDSIEAFRDLLDVNLYSVNTMANYVPIYRTVWGDFSLGHGRVLAPGKSGGSLVPELATLFLEGTIPGRIYCESPNLFLLQPEHAKELAFLKSITAYTEHGLQWLRLGEYLHSLALGPELPTIEFRESVENQVVRVPAVMHSVTRSHGDGSVAIVLVNLSEEAQRVIVPIDPALRKVTAVNSDALLRRMNERGEMSEVARGSKAWQQKMDLAPGEIAFLVLR
jgi:hypothetical protein